jgi:hypothetical protein
MVKQERSPKVLKSFLDNSMQQRMLVSQCYFFVPGMNTISVSLDPASCVGVTAKTATPTKVDSKLSDAHLESLER